ncbi:asparagine synthase (glutamine-hydrolyzing) [Magnetovibrio sp. PR-2]|uniref:asparagine synthase (glutamine-hydrolyzing) n=1 Tax=Magnetovibrio sp. PR-2 TaxID=3120356 RepID=UPI002FCE161E
MCGIVGILNRNEEPVSREILAHMTKRLAHRGPDANGVFTNGEIGIGHRRLSIVDPTPHSDQPMRLGSGRFVLSYAGELYNFKDIRHELKQKNIIFKTEGDTEVVYQALSAWGMKACERFNGMAALSWVDLDQRCLYLVRDRHGIKPLYYADLGSTLIFASEIKAMRDHPDFKPELNLDSFAEYMAFQNTIGGQTLFKNVQMVPQASIVRIPFEKDQPIETTQYYRPQFETDMRNLSVEQKAEKLDALLKEAITRQMGGKEQPSVYLSGGIDSSLISSIASLQHSPIHTIHIGFDVKNAARDEQHYDEYEAAKAISQIIGSTHHAQMMSAEKSGSNFENIILNLEDVKMGQCYANDAAARTASEFGKTVVSGLGSDELFGGYPWRNKIVLNSSSMAEFEKNIHDYWHSLTREDERNKLLSPIISHVKHVDTRAIVRDVLTIDDIQGEGQQNYFNAWRAFEYRTFLQGLLMLEDKIGMSYGVETRFPFLDNEIVEYAMQLPFAHALSSGNNKGKMILREVLRKYLPEEYAARRKIGFTGANNSWYRIGGGQYVRKQLFDPKEPIYDYTDYQFVKKLMEEHLAGITNRHRLIWALLSLNQMLKIFFHNSSAPQ